MCLSFSGLGAYDTAVVRNETGEIIGRVFEISKQ